MNLSLVKEVMHTSLFTDASDDHVTNHVGGVLATRTVDFFRRIAGERTTSIEVGRLDTVRTLEIRRSIAIIFIGLSEDYCSHNLDNLTADSSHTPSHFCESAKILVPSQTSLYIS